MAAILKGVSHIWRVIQVNVAMLNAQATQISVVIVHVELVSKHKCYKLSSSKGSVTLELYESRHYSELSDVPLQIQ